MATSELFKQLMAQQGVFSKPAETSYGAAATGITSALPGVVDPYGSTGGNLARVLGGSLLAGLLGYQAKRQAEEENKAILPELTALMGASTQEEIGNVLQQSKYADRLSPLAMSLYGQLGTAEQKAREKQESQLFQIQLQQMRNEGKIAAAEIAANAKKESEERKETRQREKFTPKQEEEISDGMYAIEKFEELYNRVKKISAPELKAMQLTGLSPSSDPGLASAIELTFGDERIKRYGASLTGNELKAFKIASGQNLLAGQASTLEAINNLRTSLIGRTKKLSTAKKLTPESLGTWLTEQEKQIRSTTAPSVQAAINYLNTLKTKYNGDLTKATPEEAAEAKRLAGK